MKVSILGQLIAMAKIIRGLLLSRLLILMKDADLNRLGVLSLYSWVTTAESLLPAGSL
jgi:hypothetical protein